MSAGAAGRVFTLPPGADYARAFARGFRERFGALPPETLAQATVYVNTGRARELIVAALAERGAGLLPRILLIPELASDPMIAPGIPLPIEPVRRQLRLTRLVEGYLAAKRAAGETVAPPGAAADLAESLALLIDQFHDAGIAPDRLDNAPGAAPPAGDAARHWQETLIFVDIVRRAWPAIRDAEEGGRPDPRDRLHRAVAALVEGWRAAPPRAPVIVAGTTGSVGSTARLMEAVAGLEAGAVVLPGLDPATEPEIWAEAGPDHPLGPFRNVLDALGLAPADLAPWAETQDHPRRALLAQALRPAPVTDHWHAAAPELARHAGPAIEGLGLIEAPGPRHEAEAIAVAVREALEEPGVRVAIVTPDAALGRRIAAALARFAVVPDDTVGQPMAQSPPGVLARLALDVAARPGAPAILAQLLQHPLVRPGMGRRAHLELSRRYERTVLRARGARAAGRLPDWPDADEHGAAWHAAIAAALAPLARALAGEAPLGALAAAHRQALAALTDAGDDDGPAAWQGEAGAEMAGLLDRIEGAADAFGEGPVADYPGLLAGLMRGRQLRPRPREPHPRVALRGPREVRLEDAELTILAGLNDGTWPAAADPGPWLSRPMHAALGLPLPERTVGLSAHDFLNAACRPRVLLSRGLRAEGAPTVASRWLIRLETLLEGIGEGAAWRAARSRGARLLALAGTLATPAAPVPRAGRPAPKDVPLPARLSVTDVERLVRDAYAVYARRVLRLRPLDPVHRPADARDRGTVLHLVLEEFARRTVPWPGLEAAEDALMAATDEVLAREVPWPDLRRAWRGRIQRFAPWFLDEEDRQRAGVAAILTEVPGRMALDIAGRAIEIVAQADRIDRLETGAAAIYDYKSGKPPTQKQIDKGFNHQLHLQAAILAAGGFDGLPALATADAAYIGMAGSGGGAAYHPELDPETVAAHLADVGRLLAAHEAGAPWTSRGRVEHERHEGDYDHLARRGEWAAEDEP